MTSLDEMLDEKQAIRVRIRIWPKTPTYQLLTSVADPTMRTALVQALCDVAVTAMATGLRDHKGALAIAALLGERQAQEPSARDGSPQAARTAATPVRKRRTKLTKPGGPASARHPAATRDDLPVPSHLAGSPAFDGLTGFE